MNPPPRVEAQKVEVETTYLVFLVLPFTHSNKLARDYVSNYKYKKTSQCNYILHTSVCSCFRSGYFPILTQTVPQIVIGLVDYSSLSLKQKQFHLPILWQFQPRSILPDSGELVLANPQNRQSSMKINKKNSELGSHYEWQFIPLVPIPSIPHFNKRIISNYSIRVIS